MSVLRIILLSVIQGLAELLPVSSSAHVVVAEKLMGMDPSSPEMTMLLVSLHAGTMLAVIVYFSRRWRRAFFRSAATLKSAAIALIVGSATTAVVGGVLILAIERMWSSDGSRADVEQLFGHLELIAPALALVGLLILISSLRDRQYAKLPSEGIALSAQQAGLIGLAQGLSLPFRGFSRSGATISTAMLAGVDKGSAEDFSFALAVMLTPPVMAREALRLIKAHQIDQVSLASNVASDVFGGMCAFLGGLLALRWLSRWLEAGRWYMFGLYCLAAAIAVATLYRLGY